MTNFGNLVGIFCRIPALLVAASLLSVPAFADKDSQSEASKHSSGPKPVGLIKEVIKGTKQYRDVMLAESAGWGSTGNCVSSPDEGAMGIHYANFPLVTDGELDPQSPEALIYEERNGKLKLVGAEFIMLADVWHGTLGHPGNVTPVLMGQLFHYTGSPNRYGLPPFYALHVWSFRKNPHGTYVNWHPKVSCDEYTGEP